MFCLYSTGPIENASDNGHPGVSSEVIVKVLNNNPCRKACVTIKAFSLDGEKCEIFCKKLEVCPLSSEFVCIDVHCVFEFEIQIKVKGNNDDVLLGVFGRDCHGKLVAAQRVLNSELTLIDSCGC